jgi:dihydroflavonol-4-reductase
MKVMVTGGTGFLGSHTVAALRDAGHGVRLLARDPAKVERVLGARGIEVDSVVQGDVADAEAVTEALEGCDAVLHAAATLYGDERTLAANLAGVRNVLGVAASRRIDPIVYVSSIASMFPPPGPAATVDDPVANLKTMYGRSKADGERIARELQARGEAVVIVYPAGIYGPDDPGMGETSKGVRDRLRLCWLITTGGSACVDVRDVARVIVACLEPGRGPRRYMAGGHFLSWAEEADLCERITGRRVRRVRLPAAVVLALGRLVDLAKRIVPFDYPLTHEAAQFVTQCTPCDSRATTEELGVEFRSTEETMADTIGWLHSVGELKARLAGRLAARTSA